MAMIRERGIVLEICPTSNLNTRVVSGWDEFRWIFDTFRRNEVRFTINTDGPEMLKTYIRDEMAQLGRLGILSVEDQELAAATSLAASFVPNVSDVPPPRLEPAAAPSWSAKRPDRGTILEVASRSAGVPRCGRSSSGRPTRCASRGRRRAPRTSRNRSSSAWQAAGVPLATW